MALPPAVQSVLELYRGPLSNLKFADVDAARLAQLGAEVEAATAEVEAREIALVELRQSLAQRQDALLALAQQALAYARVYAESNDEPLLEAITGIALPRPAKARKPGGSKSNGDAEAAPDAAETPVDGGSEAPARARRGRPKAAQAAAS